MKFSIPTYIGLAGVFILSLVLTLLLPIDAVFRGIASTPAIGALLLSLWQILRDQSQHEKQQALQRQQQIFSLGTTSHMANVAFDKHVEFCEKYMEEVHETVTTLFESGPTHGVSVHVSRFHDLKREYAAWISRDIEANLRAFEEALQNIGLLDHLVTALKEDKDEDGRVGAVQKMYGIFKQVMHMNHDADTPEIAVDAVKDKVRSILNIDALTKIRTALITQALKSLNENDDAPGHKCP